jgi:biotin-[acetyl-CoA-carboxylase] ligase BirA-like protein
VAWDEFAKEDTNKKPLLIISKNQTAGRGRMGRTWNSSNAGNLYCSLLVPEPLKNQSNLGIIPILSGVSAMRALDDAKIDTSHLRLKWPNDIITTDLEHKKVAGTLVESRFRGNHCAAIVIGFGLNTHQVPTSIDATMKPTSLAELNAIKNDISDFSNTNLLIAKMWAKELLKSITELDVDANEACNRIRQQWLSCAKVKQYPRFTWINGNIYEIIDLDTDGKLQARNLNTGEVLKMDQPA